PEARFQAFLSRSQSCFEQCKRHRPGIIYRARDCAQAWRPGVCGKRRRRPRYNRRFGAAEEYRMSRVLIVEDEAHLAKGLQFNLEAEGHSVEVARDGERALQLLLGHDGKRENFDAVVLDIMLPGKDGFAVASELRAAKNFVPVLMLTARSRPEDVLEGFASGADDYLPKPFELPILLARLQGLLRRREWMRQSHDVPPVEQSKPEEYGLFKFNGRTIDFGKLE